MSNLPLVEGLLKYVKEKNMLLCMPGHKGGEGFLNTEEGKELFHNFINVDITEVDGLDNLHHPEGIIKDAQDKLKNYYGSKKSYFLVNGSTSGNLAMIFSSFEEGDKVIVERNCHRSISNGIILRKLNPVYIKNKFNTKFNAPLSLDMEHFLCVLDNNKDAKGIIITYPNYYGACSNLKFIIDEAKKRNLKVLIDSAHGAHFGCNDKLPKSAIKLGADMVVTSSHKTLPSLTQTAYLHLNNEEDINKVDFYVSVFLSTSPSYMLMASMDYARFYLEKYGYEHYNTLINLCESYREKINDIDGFKILGKNDLDRDIYDLDLTRYVINVDIQYSGHKLLSYLLDNHIQAEMSDNQNVIVIFSPFNKKEDFEKLYKVLKICPISFIKKDDEELKISEEKIIKKQIELLNKVSPKRKILPYEAMGKEVELVNIDESQGRIAADNIVPYPPGIPIIMPGEVINEEIISIVNYCIGNKVTILGINDFAVSVLKEEA